MKSSIYSFSLILAVCFLTSCASSTKKIEDGFEMRAFQEETLPNGLRLLVIRDNSLPRVSLQMMINSGSLYDAKEKAGLTPLVFGLLDKGTDKKSAPQISDAFAQIGAEFSAQPGADFAVINASTIAPSKDEMLGLFFEVLTKSNFSAKELERLRAQHLAALQKAKDRPESYTDKIFDEVLFEGHPYGVPSLGTPEGLKNIKRDDLLAYYKAWIRPENAVLAVVGQIDDAYVSEVKKVFGAWKVAGKAGVVPARAPAVQGALKRLVTKKELQQTQIRLGHVGIQRNNPDFLKMRVGALVLGNGFASRLMQEIRAKRGLTYNITSFSDARLDPGSFEITTFTRNEKAAETLQLTMEVTKKFAAEGMTERELADAKTLLIGQFPTAIETADRLAYNLMVLRRYGIGDDYLRDYNKTLMGLTLAEVNEAVKKNIRPEDFRIVLYADQDKVLEQLKTLGNWEVVEAK